MVPSKLIVFTRRDTLLHTSRVRRLVSTVIVRTSHTYANMLLMANRLLTNNKIMRTINAHHTVLIMITRRRPINKNETITTTNVRSKGTKRLYLVSRLALPVLRLCDTMRKRIVTPFIFLRVIYQSVTSFGNRVTTYCTTSMNIFKRDRLLTHNGVSRPTVTYNIIIMKNVNRLFQYNRSRRTTNRSDVMNAIGNRSLLTTTIARNNYPPNKNAKN